MFLCDSAQLLLACTSSSLKHPSNMWGFSGEPMTPTSGWCGSVHLLLYREGKGTAVTFATALCILQPIALQRNESHRQPCRWDPPTYKDARPELQMSVPYVQPRWKLQLWNKMLVQAHLQEVWWITPSQKLLVLAQQASREMKSWISEAKLTRSSTAMYIILRHWEPSTSKPPSPIHPSH